jgi:hypothetical protein
LAAVGVLTERRLTPEGFWARVKKSEAPDDCWLWAGAVNKAGYGQFSKGYGCTLAHRYAWELVNGPIPLGLQICHKCDVPPCCNPAHLWLGTQKDNMADCVAKNRISRLGGKPGVGNGPPRKLEPHRQLWNVVAVCRAFAVCRRTVERWMEERRVQWVRLPSGRRMIYADSLLRDPEERPS